MHLSSLCHTYAEKLEEADYPNPDYRVEKLLHRLEHHDIHAQICFTKVSTEEKGNISYYLIHCKSITVANAVKLAYRIRYTDKFSDIALLMRGFIKKVYKEAK